MGASYWARWACNGNVDDLADLVLPLVLAEDYDLLACDRHKQVFDRGGLMKKIAWSLNGGRWSDAPVDLTITYSFWPDKTAADFYWSLDISPVPTTQKERACFEGWLRKQFGGIIAALDRQMERDAAEGFADEPVGLLISSTPNRASRKLNRKGNRVAGGQLTGTYAAGRPACSRSHVQYASAYVEEPPSCDRCGKPGVAIPGMTGRYYCLSCRRHLPRRAEPLLSSMFLHPQTDR
jgi:hypothetical protein